MTLTLTQARTRPPADANPTAVAAPSTGRLVALVIVLAGLFGMHGLAGHGSHAADMGVGDSMVAMASTAVTSMTGHDDGTTHLVTRAAAQAAVAVRTVPGAASSVVSGALSGGGAMSMLCLAVLTGGAFLLLLARRRPRVALARMRAPTPVTLPGLGRDRVTPSLAVLSIRRC